MQFMRIRAWWRRWRRFALIGAGSLALYALAGFWLAPKWLRAELIDQAQQQTGLALHIGELGINPFSLVLEARQLALQEGDGPVLSVERLRVDFELSSLWHRALVFREINIEAPFARAILNADGSLNLAQLIKPSAPPAAVARPRDDTPPALWIKHFAVAAGVVSFSDRRRADGTEKRLAPLAFELFDFRTTAAGGGFRFAAHSESGEAFAWNGRLALAPLSSRGKFRIERLSSKTVAGLLGDALPFALAGGTLDLHGNYRFSAGDPGQFSVRLPEITVGGLGLRARGLAESAENTWVDLPRVRIEDSRVDLYAHRLRIAAVRFEQPVLQLWREPDGGINLARLWAAGTPVAEPTARPAIGASPVPPDLPAGSVAVGDSAAPAADAAAWTFELAELKLTQAVLHVEDRAVQPALKREVAPFDFDITGISQDLGRPLAVEIKARIDGKAAIALTGALTPAPFSGTLQLELADADLRWLQPYLAGGADLDLHAGQLSGSGALTFNAPPATPAMQFAGAVQAIGFASRDRAGQRDLLNFKALRLEEFGYTLAPDTLSIGRVELDQAYARVVISEAGSLNLAQVLAPMAATTPVAPPMAVRIGRIALRDATMQFADFSIEPNFQVEIKGLAGSLRNLSSTAATPATVDLAGYVLNPYSPVSIKGSANPFAFDAATDIALSFHNIDLPVFNPYSGRFAGYSIAKGKLDTELHYRIKARQLVATHHIRLDQLEWGEATDSKDKVSLPVRMATSLLKNKDGLIDLDVPVNGSLDDPKFRVGPLVWKIVKNILVKAVTAPFRLLGGLFKGAEDARHVTFAPGSASLSETDRGNLAALAKALLDRPTLRLEVPLALVPELDLAALVEARWQQQLAGFVATEIEVPIDQAAPSYAALAAEQQRELLVDLYRREFGDKPELPEPPPASEEIDKAERRQLAEQFAIEQLTAALRARIVLDPAELTVLAQQRADAVRVALLATEGLDPARIFSTSERPPRLLDGHIQMELKLQ